ncbi:MAG: CpaD family pilus assembly lipoprotein [Alphaproteobacteria bacterium]|nr:CpaD family pilus assembly lipoprotein [Alphaproteobacteria bacterium]
MKSFALSKTLAIFSVAITLAACAEPALHPDYSVKLVPSANGKATLAVPPECVSQDTLLDPWNNGTSPQLGCAMARNLAMQVENPADLTTPKELGHPDPVVSSASIVDYRAGKTKELMDAKAEAPSSTSNSTGSGETPK